MQQIAQTKGELDQEIMRTEKLKTAYLKEMEAFNNEIQAISQHPDNILIAAQKISAVEKSRIE